MCHQTQIILRWLVYSGPQSWLWLHGTAGQSEVCKTQTFYWATTPQHYYNTQRWRASQTINTSALNTLYATAVRLGGNKFRGYINVQCAQNVYFKVKWQVITRNAIKCKRAVYELRRAKSKEDNAASGKQTINNLKSLAQSCSVVNKKHCWMKARNAGHGWTSLSAPLFSCNDCCCVTYKS